NRPADVNKMVFMVWKHVEQDDNRWMFLPALDLVKRIASTEKRTSFVGYDFFYEDVSGRNITEDKHTLLETSKNFFVIENIPKDPDSVEFSSFKMWVHRQTFITVKVEYYDKTGEQYRVYEALKVDNIQGYPTVVMARMKNLKGGETVIEYSNVKYDIGLPETIFTERYLKRVPRKYLR
ncbi:MAG: outer membrane lipoprotein-sorting protein, partial [bacterium]|nr:outer membrane lipoprotein-sorting protein [bacterium]